MLRMTIRGFEADEKGDMRKNLSAQEDFWIGLPCRTEKYPSDREAGLIQEEPILDRRFHEIV